MENTIISSVELCVDGRYKVSYKSGNIRYYSKCPKSALEFLKGVEKNDTSKAEKTKAEKPKNNTALDKSRPPKKAARRSSARGRVLACIFYPDNSEQMEFMRYLMQREKYIYIVHSPELPPLDLGGVSTLDDIHDFKAHIHFMLFFPSAITIQGFLKSSAGVLKHAEIVSDRRMYFRYMLHDTYAALKAHKKEYSVEDIKTNSPDFVASCMVDSSCECEISAVAYLTKLIDDNKILSFPELIEEIRVSGRSDLLSFALKRSYFLISYIRDLRVVVYGCER